MRPLGVGPFPVITPSCMWVSARAAVFRQEMSEGSRTTVGSTAVAKGADIRSYSFQFLVLGQHLPAGVNEWLTIRNLVCDNFRWLRICRCDVRHVQESQPEPTCMRRTSGNIWAIRFPTRCGFFVARRKAKED